MKRITKLTAGSIVAALTLLFSLISCNKNPIEDIDSTQEVETVTIRLSSPDTKTAIENDRYVIWTAGDKVLINLDVYDITIDPDDPSVATVENVTKAEEYYALYIPCFRNSPNDEPTPNVGYKDNSYDFYIQTSAEYRYGTFAQHINPMVAYGKDTNLHFYNIGSVIKVGLTGEGDTLSSLKIVTNSSVTISGIVKCSEEQIRTGDFSSIAFNESYMDLSDYSMITCDNADVTLVSSPTWFYFVTAPFSDNAGISLIAEDKNGRVFAKSKTDAFSCARSELVEMESLAFTPAPHLTLTAGKHSANSLSITTKGESSLGVSYMVVQQSLWNLYDNGSNDKEATAKKLMKVLPIIQKEESPSTVELTKAYNSTFNKVAISAETSYKVIAQYNCRGHETGKLHVIDAVTPAAEGPAPTLDISFSDISFSTINAIIKTDGASASLWLFHKSQYDGLRADGKSDAEIMKEYGKPLSDSDLEAARANGCHWSWWGLEENTDHVILLVAASDSGKEVIIKKEVKTTSHIFDKETTVLQTVSTSGIVITNLFRDFGNAVPELTLNNLTVKKVPGMDVFVIENLFKGIDELQELGFIDMTGTYFTVIDARDASAVDIRFEANRVGIYNPHYSGFNQNLRFGSYATYNTEISTDDFPLGSYDKSAGHIYVPSIILGDYTKLYGTYNFNLIIGESINNNGLSTESFNKSTSPW